MRWCSEAEIKNKRELNEVQSVKLQALPYCKYFGTKLCEGFNLKEAEGLEQTHP